MKNDTEINVVEPEVVEPEVVEPEKIGENNSPDVVKGVDWIGLRDFTESYARTLKEAYNAGLEAGRNSPKNVNSTVHKNVNGTNAGRFVAVADDNAYAVYTSVEKINNQRPYWNMSKVVDKEFGKGQYDEAVAWAMAEVSRLSGIPLQQIPPLPSVNYRTKVK